MDIAAIILILMILYWVSTNLAHFTNYRHWRVRGWNPNSNKHKVYFMDNSHVLEYMLNKQTTLIFKNTRASFLMASLQLVQGFFQSTYPISRAGNWGPPRRVSIKLPPMKPDGTTCKLPQGLFNYLQVSFSPFIHDS